MSGDASIVTTGSLLAGLQDEFSGVRAREHVVQIVQHFRAPGSSGFDAALDYVSSALTQASVQQALDEFPLDGAGALAGHRLPLAWEPRGGRLEVVSPVSESLVDWDECTSCLPWWCPPTPEGGASLDLVDVGHGLEDGSFTDVHGKAVLVHDVGENFAWPDIVERARRHGAAGIVTNYLLYQFEPWRTRSGLPDAVQQLRLPSRRDNPWTFTVPQQPFERLRGLLAAGREPVTVRFDVDAETFEGTSRSILATIPGRSLPDESIVFAAHVSAATKPGANCASGVALLLELARSMQRLIDDGRLPPPERSIHFLFGYENYDSLALAQSRPEIRDGALAEISVCSVGHDQSRTRSALVVGRAPDALPTFVNDVVEALIRVVPRELGWAYRGSSREIPRVNWKVLPYTPWSDNVTWAQLGVPALLCMSLPDRFFHTQLLTVDELDPETFRSSGLVLGMTALVCAHAGAPSAMDIIRLVEANCSSRLDALALEATSGLRRSDTPGPASGRALLEYIVERDIANMRSALQLVRRASAGDRAAAKALADEAEERLRQRAQARGGEIDRHGDGAAAEPQAPGAGSGIVPRHTERLGPHGIPGFDFSQMVELAESMRARDPSIVPESLQLFVDAIWNQSRSGRLDLATIGANIGHEFGFDLDPDGVLRLAQGLERAGYLNLRVQEA